WRDAARTVALVSNALDPPPDEAIKKCARELANEFARAGAVVVAVGEREPFLARKLFLARSSFGCLRRARVRVVIYVPTQSATLASLIRARVLRLLGRARVIVVALQPRSLDGLASPLARLIAPDLVVTPSSSFRARLRQ